MKIFQNCQKNLLNEKIFSETPNHLNKLIQIGPAQTWMGELAGLLKQFESNLLKYFISCLSFELNQKK